MRCFGWAVALAALAMMGAHAHRGSYSLLEISTRPYLYALSQRRGEQFTLSTIPDDEILRFQAEGYDMVWFMGVWQLGAYGLEHDRTNENLLARYAQVLPGYTEDDIIGSPYAVVNYTCNPELGTDADILGLKRRLNAVGIKLIVDFVPNHLAVDNVWIDKRDLFVQAALEDTPPYDPNYYLENGIAYGRDPYSGGWTDTVQLNYYNPAVRDLMLSNLMRAAAVSDGVRCDMAMLILNDIFWSTWRVQLTSHGWTKPPTDEFWETAIAAVKQVYPDFIFMAEVYWDTEPRLQAMGFDYTYDKTLLDRLETYHLDNTRAWITSMGADYHYASAHFVENHDEPRAVEAFGGSRTVANAAALVTMTLPGVRFYFEGQQYGLRNRLDVHLRRAADEPNDYDVYDFYLQLLNVTRMPVMADGDWVYAPVGNSSLAWRLMAWRYAMPGSSARPVVVIVNFSEAEGSGSVVLPNAEGQNGSDMIEIHELLTHVYYTRSASEMRSTGLFVIVPAWSAQIFEY